MPPLRGHHQLSTISLPNSDIAYGNYGILLDVFGDSGSGSSPEGIDGGILTVDNQGTISMTGTAAQDVDANEVAGIRAKANGGNGVEPDNNGTDGGRGGDGGTVTLTNSGAITLHSSATADLQASVQGLLVESQAGSGGEQNNGAGDQNGGNSGDAKSVSVTNSATISLGAEGDSIGGNSVGRAISVLTNGETGGSPAGNGGAGGVINVDNSGDLNVFYEEIGSGLYGVHGIFAKSIGGSGAASDDNDDPGGRGEEGRIITITNTGDITVELTGNMVTGESAGIMAVSVGGNGGTSSNKNVGGSGGGASVDTDGAPGGMTVNMNGGTISTEGEAVRGIVTRSAGGQGGDGNGDSRSTGGDGGFGGQIQVNFTNDSGIETVGDYSYGILGQSVGGLGGNNAGTAGSGGDAGSVGVYATSGTHITTQGDFAAGITLHSIGGGGGTGEDFTGVLSGSGGNGGNGGDGSKVSLTTASTITTSGDHAYGLLGQSIGGSGGTGGISDGLELELGGDGGGGGAGGDIDINNTGMIRTSGNYAIGILSQSISGGGGAAGTADGLLAVGGTAGSGSSNSATAYVTNSGDVTTTGNAAYGIAVQSVGGGGGAGGGTDGMLTIGGSGDAGGHGGTAQIFAVGGDVQTSGDHAYGLAAQSVGGGGGSGGDVTDVSVGAGIGVGGSGSGGGNGGAVCVTDKYAGCDGPSDTGSAAPEADFATLATAGDFAHGIVTQSVGGGGGNGGDFVGGSVASVVSVQIGGASANGGAGGAVEVNLSAHLVRTSGNSAKGIIAQSIGGGGGNGGNSTALNGVTPLSLQIGGSAGGGGAGGSTTVSLSGSAIVTGGTNAGAVLVQSVGGGGGTGGSASGYSASVGFTIDGALGGNGGAGGNGGTVAAALDAACLATGFDSTTCAADSSLAKGEDAASSHALVLQSVGGGGGTGGSSTADALTVAAPTGEGESFAVTGTVAVGGTGGSGGSGGTISSGLTNETLIYTGGDGSHGVLAQSVGGGGGDGGAASSLSASLSVPNTTSVDMAVSLGGSGGSGGHGGSVGLSVDGSSVIATFGANSNGIVAQSVGGGGGDGGIGNATNDKIGRGLNVSVDAALGGSGGSGGTGGTVDLQLDAGSQIATFGSGARGVVAQSVGGGGGTGQGGSIGLKASGFTAAEAGEIRDAAGTKVGEVLKLNAGGSITLNIGAQTGSGDTGGAITATTGGAIATSGNDADGVVVQSIGGGGGLGGTAGTDAENNSESLPRTEIEVTSTLNVTMSVGGSGGTGGHGGDVDYTHSGQIGTQGDFSDGIVVQSVGGGGGIGGAATNSDGSSTVEVDMALGGKGGAGGDGGDLTVAFDLSSDGNAPSVSTLGDNAHAVLLQSIGGGGGQGGVGTAAGTEGVEIEQGLLVNLDLEVGLSLGAGYGGNGGASGDGGDISVTAEDFDILTAGDDAYGLMAQSIGAGGGTGGVGSVLAGDGELTIDLELAVGGSGGSAGEGGNVSITGTGTIQTAGDRSFGLVAQSIGGGGGTAGASATESTLSFAFAADGGSLGVGGPVDLDLDGIVISTSGAGSHGIIAQSIGGGGGIAGDLSILTLDTSAPPVYSTPSEGSAEDTDVNVNGTIQTTGDGAYGIIAQAIGGGGGLLGQDGTLFAGTFGGSEGNGGRVNVDQSGTVSASGVNSIGIFAQSAGIEDALTVTVDVHGNVSGGSEDGAAVYVADGNDNVLNIDAGASVTAGGSVEDGTDGYAVRYQGNYDVEYGFTLTVNNAGTLTGDVLLVSADSSTTTALTTGQSANTQKAAIAGTVNNVQGATWTLNQTAGAHVVNAGTVVTAGKIAGQRYRFLGDFEQTTTGTLRVSSNFQTGQTDVVEFAGDAKLGGTLEIDSSVLAPGSQLSVLSFGGAVSGAMDVADTAAVDYRLTFSGNQAFVSINSTNFAGAFSSLDRNQTEIGALLDRLYLTDSAVYGALLADFSALSGGSGGAAAYASALDSLGPGSALAAAAAQSILSQARMDGAMTCGGRPLGDLDRMGNCSWLDIGGFSFDQSGPGAYSGSQWAIGGGAQFYSDNMWKLGISVGYEAASFTANGGQSSADGDAGYLALAAGRALGDIDVMAALTASYGTYDLERRVSLPSVSATAFGKTNITSYAARLQGAQTFGTSAGYIRPALNLDLVHTRASGYSETGAGSLNLQVQDQSQTVFIATPSVEFGRTMALTNGMTLAMFANASFSLANSDAWTSVASLTSASTGSGQFTSTVPIADRLGRVGLGVSLIRSDLFEARLEYEGAVGQDFNGHSVAVGVKMRF